MDLNTSQYLTVLQNPLIADHTLKVWLPIASPKELKNIRLVCRSWHYKSLSWWRKKAVLIINWPDASDHWSFHPNTKVTKGIFPAELYARMLHPDTLNPPCPYHLHELPFEKYALYNYRITPPNLIPENDGDAKRAETGYWNIIGENSKHVSLINVKFSNGQRWLEDLHILNFFQEYLPNLTHLTLDSVTNFESDGDKVLFHRIYHIHDVETTIPSIQSLTIINTFGVPLHYFPNVKKVKFLNESHLVKLLRTSYSPHWEISFASVTSLDMLDANLINRNDLLTTMSCVPNIRFPALAHLALNVDPVINNVGFLDEACVFSLHNFLLRHSSQLHSLHIFSPVGRIAFGGRTFIKSASVLAEVKWWGGMTGDLAFLKDTPSLKLLHIDTHAVEQEQKARQYLEMYRVNTTLDKNADLVKTTLNTGLYTGIRLQHLEYLHLDQQLSQNSIPTLGKWMPFLKTFKSVLTSQTFSVVCEQWNQLEKLHCLFSSDIRDSDICPDHRKGLYHLKNLTSFRFDTFCDKSKLTNLHFGEKFLQDLPNLKDLRICVSSRFSHQTELYLKQHLWQVRIYRNYASNPKHLNWKCCRIKHYKNHLSSLNSEYKGKSGLTTCGRTRYIALVLVVFLGFIRILFLY